MRRLTKRPRPKVAGQNKDAAFANILLKLQALKAIATHEDVAVRAMGPRSTRQFCRWQSDVEASAVEAKFEGTSADTLRKYKDEANAVQRLTKICKEGAADISRAKTRKEDGIAALRRKCDLHRVIRQIAETELVRARREVILVHNKNLTLEAQLKSSQNKARDELAELELEVSALRTEIAGLIAERRKILGIREVKS